MDRERLIAALLDPGASADDARRMARAVVGDAELLEAVLEAADGVTASGRASAFAVLKSIAEIRPERLDSARTTLLDLGRPDDPWVIPLLAGQAVARMDWPRAWRRRVRAAFLPYLESSNRFVRAWALSALWRVSGPDDPLASRLEEEITRALGIGGALGARARALLDERERSATGRSGTRSRRSS